MNFKTTLVLIVVLVGAGIALFATRNKSADKPSADPSPTATDTSPGVNNNGPKVFDVPTTDVATVTVTPTDGPAFALSKADGTWRLTDPVKAPADSFEVDSLLRALTDARSRGDLDPGTDAKATGLDAPRYKVELTTSAGKTLSMSVGERAVVGGNLYVRVAGRPKVDLVGAELADQLDKGADPYRNKQLVTVSADQIRHITIARPATTTIQLDKAGTSWSIAVPGPTPADDSAAMDLVYAVSGLRADSFVDPKRVPASALARPQVTVAFSTTSLPTTTAPATTGPSTSPANWTTVVVGSYDDVLKKNVYVSVLGSGVVAKVPASVLDSFRKSPLDLRDKAVVDVDPAQVTKVTIVTSGMATSAPSAPLVLERRPATPAVMGPTLPATGPATTQAATRPAGPPTQWVVASDRSGDADDAKVGTLLNGFHPLRADKYRESTPTTAASKRQFTVTLTTKAATPDVIVVTDPGNDGPLVATYNGLTFELPASLATDLSGDYRKGASPALPPIGTPPGTLGR